MERIQTRYVHCASVTPVITKVISVAREATRRKQPSPRAKRGKESDGEPGEELRTAYVTRAVQQLQHIQHSGMMAAVLVLNTCRGQFRKRIG